MAASSDTTFAQWHGFKGDPAWPKPRLVAQSDEAGRADQGNPITANEYLDDPATLDTKMALIAALIQRSKHTCAYTGAGLSKASGIPDYATKAANSVVAGPKIKSALDAQPTYAHCVLTALDSEGLLHSWVQQNHDGLPQKAGYPQHKLNEIHGAWFDPSNPVVQFSGNLRSDLFQWMLETEEKVDLTLALGTSLSGMNADRMAKTPAKRARKGLSLGTVVINLQRTHLDAECTIRVWAKLDDAFRILAAKLGISDKVQVKQRDLPRGNPKDVFIVPYDAHGYPDPMARQVWDLRPGSKFKIIAKGAMNEGCEGLVQYPGFDESRQSYPVAIIEGGGTKTVARLLGIWWVESALKGALPQLPLVNLAPKFISEADEAQIDKVYIKDEKPEKKEKKKPKAGAGIPPPPKGIAVPSSVKLIQSHTVRPSRAPSSQNSHEWSLRLEKGAEKFVEKVLYRLHPTFTPPDVEVEEAPFSITRVGWGTFKVEVTIYFRDDAMAEEPQVEGTHQLTFASEGDSVATTEISIKAYEKENEDTDSRSS